MINEREIIELFKKDENIILVAAYGSYSRGEEAYLTAIDGSVKLYNDFDVVVVVKDRKKFTKNINLYKKNLSNIIGGASVDIMVFDKPISKRLKKSIWYHDFIYSQKIFLGTKNDFVLYFGYDAHCKISVFDIYGMYATRSWAAGCLNINLKGNIYDKTFKSYQAAKLVIATVDFILLKHSKYTTSLKNKLEMLNLINDDFAKSLIPKLKYAIQTKLSPTKESIFYIFDNKDKVNKLISDYNHAFNCYLESNIFASNFSLKCFLMARYLKVFFVNRDYLAASRLYELHKITFLVRAHERKHNIKYYDKKIVSYYPDAAIKD